MANPELLELLDQGVEVWNEWKLKEENEFADIDLSNIVREGLVLPGIDLSDSNLSNANLSRSDFNHSYFLEMTLSNANCRHVNFWASEIILSKLENINLESANLEGVRFDSSNLTNANLRNTKLTHASLIEVKLNGADLSGATLRGTNFRDAAMGGAIIENAEIGRAIFGSNDLSEVKGLESVKHSAPSTIGTDTLHKSAGKIPEIFLRGCGLSDWQIEGAKLYQPELSNEEITNILYRVHALRASQAIQVNPLFISYSHMDNPFINILETHLNERGVRFWRDVHHSTAGRLETQIDRTIRLNPTVLLVLSEHSVKSDWVEHEARLARKLEQETGRDVLCPVALDDRWKTCRWPERLREQIMEYNVLDFSVWRDPDYMRRMFLRLMDGLGLFYK